jgi:tRNA synthetases class I (M)
MYHLTKQLGCDYSSAYYNYYCKECGAFIGREIKGSCPKCQTVLVQKESEVAGNMFVSFNLLKSISSLLKLKNVHKELEKTFCKRKNRSLKIEDITDGEKYKDLELNEFDLTFTVNTDGVPCFESSKFSLWPILISLN